MAAIERTNYPRLRPDLTADEIAHAFTPTAAELAFVTQHTHLKSQQVALLLALKCVQHLGYFPRLSAVPAALRHFICDALQQPRLLLPIIETKRTRHRHRRAVRQFLGLRPYCRHGEAVVDDAVTTAAATMSDPADLVNVAVEQLYTLRIELPAYSTLDRRVGHLRATVHGQIYARTLTRLTPARRQQLDTLLTVPEGQRISAFTRLKEAPGTPTLTNVRLWEQRLVWLNTLLDAAAPLTGLANTKIRQFARQARQLEVGDMRDIKRLGKRYLLLLCLLHEARVTTYDQLTTMFLRRMRRTHHNAKTRLEKLREEYRQINAAIAKAMGEIAHHAQNIDDDRELGGQVRHVLDEYGGADQLARHAPLVAAYQTNNHLPLMWECYRGHRALLFRLLSHLEIHSATQDLSVVEAWAHLQPYQSTRRLHLPATIALDFAEPRWQQLIKTKVQGEPVFRRRPLEVCIFHYLAVGLSRGDLFVVGAESYADYRRQLLPWAVCRPRVAAYCEAQALPDNATAFVAQLRELLRTVARRVDAAFPANSDLTFDAAGNPHLKRAPRQTKPSELDTFRLEVKARLPERHLLDVLKQMHYRIGYTRHFGPPSGNDPKMADAVRKYLLTIFGYGCGLGAAQTARHTRGIVTRRLLKRINDQHIAIETLQSATTDVINEYARFQLPFLWGSGKHAVADGTHVKLLDNNLLGQHHFRFGEYGAIAYHHVSDTYIAIFSHFFACGVWEAVYILDGLLKNESTIQPDTLHADTQGQSAAVFGLAYLLGIRLMPRMRNWNKVDLCRPDAGASYRHINLLFNATVNWDLIERHWPDLLQVVLSIQAGNVLPSMLLQKLGTHNRRHKLHRAFAELGRAVRTIFLLEYLSDIELRQQIVAATTVVERYNDFLDWLSFGGDGIIRVADPVEQEKRIKYLNLVANTVLLQNVVDMTHVLAEMNGDGHPVTRDLISHLSPYMTEHIKRFGEYYLEMDEPPEILPPDNDFLKSLR